MSTERCPQGERARPIVEALSEHRRVLARQLHDGAIQDLTVAHVALGIRPPAEAGTDVDALVRRGVTKAVEEVRSLQARLLAGRAPVTPDRAWARSLGAATALDADPDARPLCPSCAAAWDLVIDAVRPGASPSVRSVLDAVHVDDVDGRDAVALAGTLGLDLQVRDRALVASHGCAVASRPTPPDRTPAPTRTPVTGQGRPAPTAPPAGGAGRGGVVVVVEDDQDVLDVERRILDRAGIPNLGCRDAGSALRVVLADPGAVRCVVTDQRLGAGRGTALAAALHETLGDGVPPVLVVSGAHVAAPSGIGPVAVLAKPFLPDALVAGIADACLGAAREPATVDVAVSEPALPVASG